MREKGAAVVMSIEKIVLLALVGVFLGVQFKSSRQEFSVYIGVMLSIVIFFEGMEKLGEVLERLKVLEGFMGSQYSYFGILLKVVGITYLCEFASSVCRDAGFAAVAGQIEIFGKLTVLLSGMPVILAVIETIQEFAV